MMYINEVIKQIPFWKKREITLFHIGNGECCIMSASCVITGISLDVQLYAEEETEILAIHSGIVQKLMDSNVYVRCFAYELATKRLSYVVWVMQEIIAKEVNMS